MAIDVQIIEGSALSNMCDYSFGDHLGGLGDPNLIGGFMKEANIDNKEFVEKVQQFKGKTMTLFIDNIRLYYRQLWVKPEDVVWVEHILSRNNLLALCEIFSEVNFIIFTSHEDTPIDEQIVVPANVAIYAVNAVYNNDKIHPFPIGLQRQIGLNDNRLQVMKELVKKDKRQIPTKLLYINCGLGTERNEEERAYLPIFNRFEWATGRFHPQSKFYSYEEYPKFLHELKDHKFVICPKGHGMDCHRNWETLYMRRVPIFKEHPYFRLLMKDYPVLFVNEWSDITPKLLIENDFLYKKAQKMDLKNLDLTTLFRKYAL